MSEATGTFACPICGYDKPHPHSEAEQAAYREDQMRGNDGWTSNAKRRPAKRGWYLCRDVEVPFKRPGFDDWNPRSSQLSWFLWVRDGASCGDKVPEVLHFDGTRWSLRNLLGNAAVSGAESRYEVEACPRYWREVPALGAPVVDAHFSPTQGNIMSEERLHYARQIMNGAMNPPPSIRGKFENLMDYRERDAQTGSYLDPLIEAKWQGYQAGMTAAREAHDPESNYSVLRDVYDEACAKHQDFVEFRLRQHGDKVTPLVTGSLLDGMDSVFERFNTYEDFWLNWKTAPGVVQYFTDIGW